MKLKDIELLPGEIVSVDDPNHIGRIKANVPTLFDSSKMNPDGMPWIYKLTIPGYQNFSSMQPGERVWVIKNLNNYNEFWYIPMPQMNDAVKSILTASDDDYINSDILINRQIGDNNIQLHYTPTTGMHLQINDKLSLNIHPDNGITMTNDEEIIHIEPDKISIGTGEKSTPAVRYDDFQKLMNNLNSAMNNLANLSRTTPYTQALGPGFTQAANAISSAAVDACSATNTYID
jgi:hypothetical protein